MLQIIQARPRRNNNYFPSPTISGELRGERTAAAAGISAHGYAPALALCRKLIAAGHDPHTKLNLFRKTGTLALTVRSIGEGARLTVEDGNTGRPQFKPIREKTQGTASPMRRNEAALGGDRSDPSDAPDEGVS
jgi:hypothetical protein